MPSNAQILFAAPPFVAQELLLEDVAEPQQFFDRHPACFLAVGGERRSAA